MDKAGFYCVITAFTPDFWDDFVIFYNSLRKTTMVHTIVVPLEFKKEDFEKLSKYHVDVFMLPDDDVKHYKGICKTRWMQWFKPKIIKDVIESYGINTALWLDVDIVILNDLKPLFKATSNDFLVMNDFFAPQYCLNDDKLYDHHPAPVPKLLEKIALNSGVVGVVPGRDDYILDKWIENTEIINNDQKLKDYITLYDQGVLLWTMRELGILDKITPSQGWNGDAKRNAYELNENSKWPKHPQWPRTDTVMGGDILDEVLFDNPDMIIAHYAGMPKLSHLCQIDNKHSIQYMYNKHGEDMTTRIFGIGLERAGTHTLAESIRRSSRHSSWVRHEIDPTLSKEAKLKFDGDDYMTQDFNNKMQLYKRTDVKLVCEVNHRLSFFVDDINENCDNAKFILLLRNPVDLIKSRMLNFSTWISEFSRTPGFYQFDMYSIHRHFKSSGSSDQNSNRIRPDDISSVPIVDLHLWEIIETLKCALNSLKNIDDDNYSVVWIEDLNESQKDLNKLLNGDIIWREFLNWSNRKFGSRLDFHDEKTVKWVNTMVNNRSNEIIDQFFDLLSDFGVKPRLKQYL